MLRLTGPPEEAAAQLIACLKAKGILDEAGEVTLETPQKEAIDPPASKGGEAGATLRPKSDLSHSKPA